MSRPLVTFQVKEDGEMMRRAWVSIALLKDARGIRGICVIFAWPFGRVESWPDMRRRAWQHGKRYPHVTLYARWTRRKRLVTRVETWRDTWVA